MITIDIIRAHRSYAMKNDSPSEVPGFLTRPADRAAIQAYLSIGDDREICRLAAMMAPKQEIFDPAEAVDAATALQAETVAGSVRRREEMVETMNYATLLALQQELEVPLGHRPGSHKQLKDPVVGPVLRKVHSVKSMPMPTPCDDIADASSLGKVPRPQLPCSLANAVRYVTNSPDVPWQVLERALIDYHRDHPNSCLLDPLRAREERVRKQIDQAQTNRTLGGTETMKLLRADLSVVEAAIRERETIVPGVASPASTSGGSSHIYTHVGGLVDGRVLDSLSTDFLPFWVKNGAAYLKRHTDADKAKKKKASTNRTSAALASASRERVKWLKVTRDFVEFRKEAADESTSSVELLLAFSRSASGVSTTAAQEKVRDFLGTLTSYEDRGFTGEILDFLRTRGFKALTDDTVRECLGLMKPASGGGLRKKSKKNRF